MRGPALFLAAIVIGLSHGNVVHAEASGLSHDSALSGVIHSPICSSDNFASGHASGDLSGSFFVAFDCTNGAISGGEWLILVTVEAPDGTTDVIGSLRGRVLEASIESDGTGVRVSVHDALLTITEGTGNYASVVAGTGSLNATSDPGGMPQFIGAVNLRF